MKATVSANMKAIPEKVFMIDSFIFIYMALRR
jgi:hypothetical protein